MDPNNEKEFAGKKALDYWNQVDVYIGGSEHAVAHLLYSRLWIKILHDLGFLNFDEPFKKLINQGKITGVSKLVYRASFRTWYETHDGERGHIRPLLLISKKHYDSIVKGQMEESVIAEMHETAL